MKKLIPIICCALASVYLAPSYANNNHTDTVKANMMHFYNDITNEKNFDAASQYLGRTYTQHNPTAADGPEGLRGYIQWLREKYPAAHSEVKRIFVNGNYVIMHVNFVLEPNTKGLAIVDIFRLEKNKVVEHWDVIQPVPEQAANNNGMF